MAENVLDTGVLRYGFTTVLMQSVIHTTWKSKWALCCGHMGVAAAKRKDGEKYSHSGWYDEDESVYF